MKKYQLTLISLVTILLTSGCAIIKNYPQKSKYMQVVGGSMNQRMNRGDEKTYGVLLNLENVPKNAKYVIADFELQNNDTVFDKKIYPISQNSGQLIIKSDPIYGVGYGFYYITLHMSEDKYGKKILDSLKQSIKILGTFDRPRSYAVQYSISQGGEKEEVVILYPYKKRNKIVSGKLPKGLKIGYAGITHKGSIIEYVPQKETVHNWTEILTINEYGKDEGRHSSPHIHAILLLNAFYKKFYKGDEKNMRISVVGFDNDGNFFNNEDPNFEQLFKKSNNINVVIDYKDPKRLKKHPGQREFLVSKYMMLGGEVRNFQYTARYNKKWSKRKIKAIKQKAMGAMVAFQYRDKNPLNSLELTDDLNVKSQRLDDRDLNDRYKDDTNKK